MADRKVFTAAMFTAVLLLAGAFVLPRSFFLFELAKSSIYFAVAALVYYAEDRYGYMLGMVAPPLWFAVDWMAGTLGHDFRALGNFLVGRSIAPLETPLHALARLAAIVLFIVSVRTWHREVPEKIFGKPLWTGLAASLIYVGGLTAWYFFTYSAAVQAP
jgi:hypothetical protein